jgi:soluble lytic murein transglycosylase
VEEELRGLRERYRLVAAVKTVVGERIPDSTQFQLVDLVYRNSRRFGYDPLLVLAVIHVESVFDPRALGRYRDGRVSGALGLMQLKPATAREVAEDLDIELSGPSDLFRPEINIVLGVAYLTRLVSRFESFKLGLLAYNQGPGTIMQDLSARRPLSIRYYRKVLRSYYRLSEEVAEKGPLT